MKVECTLYGKFSTYTFLRQKILNTSNNEKKKDFNNNKKEFSGINKECT